MSERKKVKLRVTFETWVDVPSDWEESMVRFHYEENHCVQNLIESEAINIRATPGICNTCAHAEVKVISIGEDPEEDGDGT